MKSSRTQPEHNNNPNPNQTQTKPQKKKDNGRRRCVVCAARAGRRRASRAGALLPAWQSAAVRSSAAQRERRARHWRRRRPKRRTAARRARRARGRRPVVHQRPAVRQSWSKGMDCCRHRRAHRHTSRRRRRARGSHTLRLTRRRPPAQRARFRPGWPRVFRGTCETDCAARSSTRSCRRPAPRPCTDSLHVSSWSETTASVYAADAHRLRRSVSTGTSANTR